MIASRSSFVIGKGYKALVLPFLGGTSGVFPTLFTLAVDLQILENRMVKVDLDRL